jgi:flagellar hook-length control protein FliK
MVSTQHTTFSAAQKSYHHSPTLVAPSDSETAAEQFVNVLDQLLGKSTRVSSADSLKDLDTAPGEMIYSEKEEAAPVKEEEQCQAKAEESTEEKKEEDTEEAVVDASTAALLVKQNQSDHKEIKEVKAEEHSQGEHQAAKVVTKAEKAEDKMAFEAQKEVLKDVFKLVKQAQVAIHKEGNTDPLEQLQANLENYFKTQPEKVEAAATAVNTGVESDLQIEKILEVKADLKDFLSGATRANTLKESSVLSPKLEIPSIGLNMAERYSAELAKFATRGSVGSNLLKELSKDREPVAALSLLGEKSKVQSNKETGKTNQLSSRQEQIINQILKLVDQATKLKDGTSLTIRIKPEELGEVLVKVSQRGDQLIARIVPEHKEVEQTVRVGINEVIAQLVSCGFKPENIHVSVGKEMSDSESFAAFHNMSNQGAEQGLEGQNLLNKGDRHGSSLSNPDSSGSKSDSKNAFSTLNGAVDNGWVA